MAKYKFAYFHLFLNNTPAELRGLSSDWSQAACPYARASAALGLDLGCEVRSRGPGRGCSHTGVEQVTPEQPTQVLFLDNLSKVKWKKTGNFFWFHGPPCYLLFLRSFQLHAVGSAKAQLVFNTAWVFGTAFSLIEGAPALDFCCSVILG